MVTTRYTGRFAPTPSGPLHLGSLTVALASFLSARSRGGRWLIRIDDLDPPRQIAGASEAILDCLRSHALHWDAKPLYQSEHDVLYQKALQNLQAAEQLFACFCSRKMLLGQKTCSGSCSPQPGTAAGEFAWRLRVQGEIHFVDRVQGAQHFVLEKTLGNFIVRRRDGLFAYHLATVVDDAWQGISEVIRGCDLLESTAAQICLQRHLGLPTPAYAHLPLIRDHKGRKLSKHTGEYCLEQNSPTENLRSGLRLLGQPEPPAELKQAEAILQCATDCWQPRRIPHVLHQDIDIRPRCSSRAQQIK